MLEDRTEAIALPPTFPPPVQPEVVTDDIFHHVTSGHLWVVNPRRRNGLVIYRRFHAVFAGPGAAVGGGFDAQCTHLVPLGRLSLLAPASPEEWQKALRIRLQWVRLTPNFTDRPASIERAQMILEQFKMYFGDNLVATMPDEAFARLVGVFPETVRLARQKV